MTSFVIVAVLALVSLAVSGAVVSLRRFNNKTEEICERLENTGNDTEYKLVKRELDCHYLTLIPFVNNNNSLKVYSFFYKGRHMRADKKSDTLSHILMPSILGIALCATCICTATWAWFSASRTNSVQQIKSAEYSLSVYVTDNNTGEAVSGESEVEFKLSDGSYTIKLTADKTAEKGYGKVSDTKGEFVTDVIVRGDSLTFKYITSGEETLVFSSSWGDPDESAVNLKDGNVIDRTTGNNSADTVLPSENQMPIAFISSKAADASGSIPDNESNTLRADSTTSVASTNDTASSGINDGTDESEINESAASEALSAAESSEQTTETGDKVENENRIAPESAISASGEN